MRLASSASSSSASSSPPGQSVKLPTPSHITTKLTRRRPDKELSNYKSGYPLQRGSACLSCRKRKMKCDAGKPSCGQCIKANRASDCDYDDGKSKSRTQLLQDKIAMLEGRIRELETPTSRASEASPPRYVPSNPAASSAIYAPDVFANNELYDITLPRPSVSNDSPSGSGSPWISNQYDTHSQSPGNLQWDMDSRGVVPELLLKSSGRWWEASQPPQLIKQLLIEVFLPHRLQCGFNVDPSRFQASVASSDPPHPALLNAIYALACHFSLSVLLSPHEQHFISRALSNISDALETSEKLIDVLQASCLLAVLFFIKGRLLEGYYHAGAAARLAVGLGLHQIVPPGGWSTPPDGSPSPSHSLNSESGGSSSILPPPVDSVEFGERVLAFWQVFNLDRCWAVATGLPVALPDDSHPRTRIETAWPRSLEDYEIGHTNDADLRTTNGIYSQMTTIPIPFSPRDSTNCLRAKATTLFERAAHLASSFGTSAQTAEKFWIDYQAVDTAITRTSMSVPPVRVEDEAGGPARIDHSLFTVHLLLHAASIHLHSPFALKDGASQQKSVVVASLATSMIHQLEDADYQFLDPIMGTCWTSVAEALVREIILLRSSSALGQVSALNRQLDTVIAAMNRLGSTIPLAAYQASKVEQSRDVTF